ncbi:hypothetical protein CPB86DRAFT_739259 [Serendipita vermifera]|nr:hypothetical protein CPB86DRAFT_739259 [Serendipita vermifera]
MSKPPRWIPLWLTVAIILVTWDAGYCFSRPRSFAGGDWHWIWKPYALYQNIDLVYGVEAYRRGDGFTNAQSLLNVFETLGNVVYLWKSQVTDDPIAPLIGFSVALASFSKTILYWAQEYYCGYCAVGHNDAWTLFWLWMIPNGAWLVFPGMMIWVLGSQIASTLRGAAAPARSNGHIKSNGHTVKANGKHH